MSSDEMDLVLALILLLLVCEVVVLIRTQKSSADRIIGRLDSLDCRFPESEPDEPEPLTIRGRKILPGGLLEGEPGWRLFRHDRQDQMVIWALARPDGFVVGSGSSDSYSVILDNAIRLRGQTYLGVRPFEVERVDRERIREIVEAGHV